MTRPPWPNIPEARRAVMQANKGKDTKPEITMRRLLQWATASACTAAAFPARRRSSPPIPPIQPTRRRIKLKIRRQ